MRLFLTFVSGGLLIAVLNVPALAASDRQISEYVELSDQFNSKLPRSTIAGLTERQQRLRADCILDDFEDRFGQAGVSRLMELMRVLARGAEFDDPTIVGFNEAYGAVYDRMVSDCTRTARSS